MNLLSYRLLLRMCLFTATLFSTFVAGAQLTINTIAGDGTAAFGGDGGPASAAKVNNPYAVSVDAIGNVFIADYGNNRIRKIDTFGNITTIAGTGVGGFSGDGGPATGAKIFGPRGVTSDAAGNVYFSDYANCRIRKINTAGIISTVAGNGTAGFSGDAGPATAAKLNYPWGLGLDAAGNLYIADQLNCRIRKVNTSGTIATIGGTGIAFFSGDGGPAVSAGIQYPMGLAVDGPGNIYICDEGDCRIRKINTSGVISTIAGNGSAGFTGDGGPATNAKIYYPQGIALDNSGNFYIADLNNYRIRKVSAAGVISTVIGTGTGGFSGDGGLPTLAKIDLATGVAVDNLGRIYISDNNNNRIRITHVLSHAPIFTHGDHFSIESCPIEFIAIDTLLRITDVDTGQTETWNVVLPASHGAATVSYTALSTGGTLTPSGTFYLPTYGYAGLDSFKVRVNDGTYSDTITIIINMLPLPDTGIISGIDTLCPGATFTFTDTVSGGVWTSSNTGSASISGLGVVTAGTPGATIIRYTVTNSCGSRAASFPVRISANCHTAVNNVMTGARADFVAFPNPASETITLNLHTPQTETVAYTVLNATGQIITTATAETNTAKEISINTASGIYFVTAATASGRWEKRITVIR